MPMSCQNSAAAQQNIETIFEPPPATCLARETAVLQLQRLRHRLPLGLDRSRKSHREEKNSGGVIMMRRCLMMKLLQR
jgi:hypothetical protein